MRRRYFVIALKYSDQNVVGSFVVGCDLYRSSQYLASLWLCGPIEAPRLEVECRALWADASADDVGNLGPTTQRGANKSIKVRIVQS